MEWFFTLLEWTLQITLLKSEMFFLFFFCIFAGKVDFEVLFFFFFFFFFNWCTGAFVFKMTKLIKIFKFQIDKGSTILLVFFINFWMFHLYLRRPTSVKSPLPMCYITFDGYKKSAGFQPNLHYIMCLTGGNWQKWKRVFLTCPCHKIYRDEAVGLKSCKNTWKNYDICENVKFGAISWKFDILSITA